MGIGSIWPWVIVLAIVMLLFGRGKISGLMGDVADGVKSFKRGLKDDEAPKTPKLEDAPAAPVETADTGERTNAAP